MDIFGWISPAKRKRQEVECFMIKLVNHMQLRELLKTQRQEKRIALTKGVRVIPVVRGRYDRTRLFNTALRDVTLTGMSFVDGREFRLGDQLVLTFDFDHSAHHLLCEVKHCTNVGRGLFQTGCQALETLAPTADLADDPDAPPPPDLDWTH